MRAGANPASAHPAPAATAASPEIFNPAAAQPPAVAHASARLEDDLDRVGRLLAACETLAVAPGPGQVVALQAAAKLMHANAALAAAVLRLAHGETRHRTIVERPYQSPGRLYSNYQEGEAKRLNPRETSLEALQRRLNHIIAVQNGTEDAKEEQDGKDAGDDGDKSGE